MLSDLARDANRDRACWYLLRAVDASRPVAAKGSLVRKVLAATSFELTELEFRREVDFLVKAGLVTCSKNDVVNELLLELTAEGVCFTRYSTPDMAGIDRPPRRVDE